MGVNCWNSKVSVRMLDMPKVGSAFKAQLSRGSRGVEAILFCSPSLVVFCCLSSFLLPQHWSTSLFTHSRILFWWPLALSILCPDLSTGATPPYKPRTTLLGLKAKRRLLLSWCPLSNLNAHFCVVVQGERSTPYWLFDAASLPAIC